MIADNNRPGPVAPAPPPHLLGVLRTLWQWRRAILLTTAAAAVLAIVISLLLPSYYSSTTSFLVVNPAQFSTAVVFGADGRVPRYGSSDDMDRILAIAESDLLVDRMVERFHLYRHYDVDSSVVKAPLQVRREFLSHYEVKRTPRDVIELTVEDKDPVLAAEMARTARDIVDEIALRLLRTSQVRTMEDLNLAITTRQQSLDSMTTSLSALRERYGVYDTEAQREAVAARTTELEETLNETRARIDSYRTLGGRGSRDSIAKLRIALAGLESARVTVDSQLMRLNESVNLIDGLEKERDNLNTALSYNRLRAKEYATILQSKQRTVDIVEEARVPVVKSRPVRWLIVAVSTVVAFVLAAVGALLIDNGRRYDWARIIR